MKTYLETAMKANKSKCWIQFIDGILTKHNSRNVTGCRNFRRDSVTKENYLELLKKKYKTSEPEALLNLSVVSNFSPRMGDLLFKYSVGDRVLYENKADYTTKTGRGAFDKISILGAYGMEKKYTVVKRLLKTSANFYHVPAYNLSGLGKHLVYESEIIPYLFSEEEEGRIIEEKNREEGAKKKKGRKAVSSTGGGGVSSSESTESEAAVAAAADRQTNSSETAIQPRRSKRLLMRIRPEA